MGLIRGGGSETSSKRERPEPLSSKSDDVKQISSPIPQKVLKKLQKKLVEINKIWQNNLQELYKHKSENWQLEIKEYYKNIYESLTQDEKEKISNDLNERKFCDIKIQKQLDLLSKHVPDKLRLDPNNSKQTNMLKNIALGLLGTENDPEKFLPKPFIQVMNTSLEKLQDIFNISQINLTFVKKTPTAFVFRLVVDDCTFHIKLPKFPPDRKPGIQKFIEESQNDPEVKIPNLNHDQAIVLNS